VADKVKNLSLYRSIHGLRHGGLHRALGISESETIPKEKIAAARNSTNPHVKKMAEFAHTMSKWKH
jgi:hypothetical protein